MAQKIIVILTKTKSFIEAILWDDLKIALACNGDIIHPLNDPVNDRVADKFYWQFNHSNTQGDLARSIRNIHHAIEMGWKLLAPPTLIKVPNNYWGKHNTYEWWLIKD